MQNKSLNPQVSILLPFYNEKKYISKAILSVLQQNVNNWELILLDDSSTDNTLLEIRKILKKLNHIHDQRIIYRRFSINRGKAAVLNDGLAIAQGEFILELDGDDWLHPHAISRFLSEIENQSEQVAMLYSDYITLKRIPMNRKHTWEKQIVVGKPIENLKHLVNDFFVPTPRFYRKNALMSIGGWPIDYPSYGRLYEDVAVIFKLLQNYQIAYLPKVTMFVRKHSDSITKSNQKAWIPLFKYLTAKYLNHSNAPVNEAPSKKDDPLVSIIIPFQNQEKVLPFLLQSINHQDYQNIEIVFVNDHSSDESQLLINTFPFHPFIEPKIIHLSDEVGRGAAIKKALGMIKGKYFLVCSPYEVLFPEAISVLVHFMEGEENRLMVGIYGGRRMFESFPKFKFVEDQRHQAITPLLCQVHRFKEDLWNTDYISEGNYFSELFNIAQALETGTIVSYPHILSMHLQADIEKIERKAYEAVKLVISKKLFP